MAWGWKQANGMRVLATVPVIFSGNAIIALCRYGGRSQAMTTGNIWHGWTRRMWARFPVALTVGGWPCGRPQASHSLVCPSELPYHLLYIHLVHGPCLPLWLRLWRTGTMDVISYSNTGLVWLVLGWAMLPTVAVV